VQELVGAVRAIRAEYDVQPGKAVRVVVQHPGVEAAAACRDEENTIRRLAKISELLQGDIGESVGGYAVLSDGTGVFVPLGDAIDVARECARLGAEIARLQQLVASQEKKLSNEQFVSRAPADVVGKEREKLATWREQVSTLQEKRGRLGC
jgi:valyl-tRNA synthetase